MSTDKTPPADTPPASVVATPQAKRFPEWTSNGMVILLFGSFLGVISTLGVNALNLYSRIEKIDDRLKSLEKDQINAQALDNHLTTTNTNQTTANAEIIVLKSNVSNLQQNFAALGEWKAHTSETVKNMDCSTTTMRERIAKLEAKTESK